MDLSGAPKTVFDIVDASILKDVPNAGWTIVQGRTKRGKAGVAYYITNPLSYVRLMGDEWYSTDPFPTYCKRILNAGGKLIIGRAVHYADVADPTTVAGTKATGSIISGGSNSAWRAEEVGTGYNGTTIVIAAAASGTANKFDVTITLKDSDTTTKMVDVANTMTAGELADFNRKLLGKNAGVELVSITTAMVAGNVALAAGAETLANVVAADFNGSSVGGTGWYAFNQVTEAARIAQIGIESEVVDEGLRVYTEQRQDLRYMVATPLGVNSTGMLAYRNGTTPYSHAAMDSIWGTLITGDINITDSNNDDLKYNIPGLVDVIYLKSRSDSKNGPWISAAGSKRGKILMPNNGVPYNLGSAALAGDYDLVYPKGVNAVIKDAQFGTVYWGNKSLKRDTTSLLNKDNVCDLLVNMIRTLKPLVRVPMFDPNAPKMWAEIYNRVKPTIEDYESRQAIEPGENDRWFWIGDQAADKKSDAKFNIQADLDSGRYRARFVFIPLTATEFIGIELVATDSGSLNFVVVENPQL